MTNSIQGGCKKKFRVKKDGIWTDWMNSDDFAKILGSDQIEAVNTSELMSREEVLKYYPDVKLPPQEKSIHGKPLSTETYHCSDEAFRDKKCPHQDIQPEWAEKIDNLAYYICYGDVEPGASELKNLFKETLQDHKQKILDEVIGVVSAIKTERVSENRWPYEAPGNDIKQETLQRIEALKEEKTN